MRESNRKHKRFDVPLSIRFRPTYGATEFAAGKTVNLSLEGIGLYAKDFRFIVYEHLELIIEPAGNRETICTSGDVLWKRQDGKSCLAGIKFRFSDRSRHAETLRRIFSDSHISRQDMHSSDPPSMTVDQSDRPAASEPVTMNEKLAVLPNKLGPLKQYQQGGKKCLVTFRLLRDMARRAKHVALVGDFNNWDIFQSPMTRLENGDFVISMHLDCPGEYRFRYLIDGHHWENDWYADRFVLNDYGSKDSLIIL